MLWARTALALTVALIVFARPVGATESSVPFIRADEVHEELEITGAGATVAVIDSGVHYSHPGLGGGIASGGLSIINGDWFYDDGADPDPPGESHGTYMSLIITDGTGVAPDALILPVRVGDLWDVVDAVEYVTGRRETVDPTIRVINISMGSAIYYGCSCDDQGPVNPDLAEVISNAAAAGIVTFAATGNESECWDGICSPACVSTGVRVAADYDDYYGVVEYRWPDGSFKCDDWSQPYWVTCFSNITEYCDWFLAAPGYDITVGNYFGNGTSQATAHCSGVAALMASKAGPCGPGGWSARETICWHAITPLWPRPECVLIPQPRPVDAYSAVYFTAAVSCARGDLNCDGTVDAHDIDPFTLALTSYPDFEAYDDQYPWCDGMLADINCDGVVDAFDIDPFVVCVMLGECPPCP